MGYVLFFVLLQIIAYRPRSLLIFVALQEQIQLFKKQKKSPPQSLETRSGSCFAFELYWYIFIKIALGLKTLWNKKLNQPRVDYAK